MKINFSFGFILDEEIINNLKPKINLSSSETQESSRLNNKMVNYTKTFSLNGCSYYVFGIESFFDINKGIIQTIYSQSEIIENIFRNVKNIHQRYAKLFSESNNPINYKIYLLFSIIITTIIWICLKLVFYSALILCSIFFCLLVFIHIYYLYPRNFSLVMQLDNLMSSLIEMKTNYKNTFNFFKNNNIIIIEINHCDGSIDFHYKYLEPLKNDFLNIQMMNKNKSDFYNEMFELFQQELQLLQSKRNIYGYIDSQTFKDEQDNYKNKVQKLKEKFKLNEINEFN